MGENRATAPQRFWKCTPLPCSMGVHAERTEHRRDVLVGRGLAALDSDGVIVNPSQEDATV